jgi:hypothetical protein
VIGRKGSDDVHPHATIIDGFCKKSASKLRSRIEAVKGVLFSSSFGSVPILCLWIFGVGIHVQRAKGGRKKVSLRGRLVPWILLRRERGREGALRLAA